MNGDDMKGVLVVGLVVGALFLLFLPYMVASYRNHKNAGAILVLSLLLGWTLVGWTVAIVWALMADQEAPRYARGRGRSPGGFDPPPPPPPPVPMVATPALIHNACPHCASDVPIPLTLAGTPVACPYCRGVFTATR